MTSVLKRKNTSTGKINKYKTKVEGSRMKGCSNEEIQAPEIFITISCLALTLDS
jgi:hypothetical protein